MKYSYKIYFINLIIIVTLFYSSILPAQEITYEPIDFNINWFLTKGPVVTGFDGPYAIVEFETAIPSPGAIAYYGIVFPDEELGFPNFRKNAIESLPEGSKNVTSHKIKIDISGIESSEYDMGNADAGGLVAYRIEIFNPRSNAARIYDSSFRYSRDGKPKTGNYILLTTLTEGPFVNCVTNDSAIISWETDQPTSGTVYLNDEMPVTDKNVSTRHEVHLTGLKADRQYTYRIIYAKDGITPSYSFHTAPTSGSQRSFKFGFVADSRGSEGGGENFSNAVNAKILSQLTSELYYKGVEFVCFPGDLGTGYTSNESDLRSQLKTWKQTIQPIASRIPFYVGMGNHEQLGDYYKVTDPAEKGSFMLLFAGKQGDKSPEAYFSREFVNPEGSVYGFGVPSPESRATGAGGPETGPIYNENVYSLNYGNAHFVMLNTEYWYSGVEDAEGFSRKFADKEANNIAFKQFGGNREGYIRQNQLDWLDRDLRSAQEDANIDVVFIMFHDPVFPNGGHVKDSMFWGTAGKGELGGLNDPNQVLGDVMDMRNRFLSTIVKYSKVTAILCGHEHNYNRTRIDSSLYPDCQKPLWQIISGRGGASFYVQDKSVPWVNKVANFTSSYNYCVLTVEGKRVGLDVYSNTGQVIDHVEDLNTTK